MENHKKIILNKDNFDRIFTECTGIGMFDNPYNYTGVIRENQKALAMYYLNNVWGDKHSIEWDDEDTYFILYENMTPIYTETRTDYIIDEK